jgi:hypothetical protein
MPVDDDPRSLRPATSSRTGSTVSIAVVLLIAAAAAWWFWGRTPPPPAAVPVAQAPAEPPVPAPAPAPEPTGPQNPVDALQTPDTALPALAASDSYVLDALVALLGKGPVSSLLQTDDFARRVVATADNLTRAQAASRLWPVQPSPSKFQVEGAGKTQTIAPANAKRYGAVLSLAESVPMERMARLYAGLYPLFQQAYEELGYPRGYFNDRLVAVLDHLQQAPEPQGPLRVQLTEVKGELADPRPWVRYEFVDPELQALSSGQKILVRMGPENERRAKALLATFRQQIVTGAVARK